jgi:hypothetical protein
MPLAIPIDEKTGNMKYETLFLTLAAALAYVA